ncbi:hypothetical protein IFM89_000452 [Coptis chinensis]|uniref:MAPK kinase substrate protein n=1 Tax=Coptis chinensis TaxID=261450 RepID=A0A835I4P1_9MAGN|nr:hypothetical protein IFM89_000452 [Coptis chinensis]
MAGLQRSAISFRRQGSSGLVWEDPLASGELDKAKKKEGEEKNEKEEGGSEFRELRQSKSVGSIKMIERSRSNGGRGYRTGKVTPSLDPPSPKVSACGFCSVFSKPVGDHRSKTKNGRTGKRKS